mmetsp:Transcript_14017/g.37631  ORF Transcript_14017/g.37631 Transcript_14017/m.37631 type:complete len:254 (+) Transcript_14017:33-794(+)
MESASATLWSANMELIKRIEECEFVRRLSAKTVDVASFQFYITQDAIFLEGFGKAYCALASVAEDWVTFSELVAKANGVIEERRMHDLLAKKWGVDLSSKALQPAAATRDYLQLIKSSLQREPIAVAAIAALVPCMRLYAHLGVRARNALASQPCKSEVAENFNVQCAEQGCAHWIETYSSEEFGLLATELEQLFDRAICSGLATAPNDEGRAEIWRFCRTVYNRALECELAFFNQAQHESVHQHGCSASSPD